MISIFVDLSFSCGRPLKIQPEQLKLTSRKKSKLQYALNLEGWRFPNVRRILRVNFIGPNYMN